MARIVIDYVQDQLLPYFWHWRGFLEGRMQLCRTPTILRVLEREFHSVMKPSNKCARSGTQNLAHSRKGKKTDGKDFRNFRESA